MPERKVPIDLLIAASISAMAVVLLIPVIALVSTRRAADLALSNLHRISQATILYTEGYDDHFPVGDSCLPDSSLNVELDRNKHFVTDGCGSRSYDRINADHWQKWLEPYFDNNDVFENALRDREPLVWEARGILANGFLINTGMFGFVPSDPKLEGSIYSSWHGGTYSTINNPNAALLILDLPSYSAALPVLSVKGESVAYPMAVREFYQYMVHTGTLSDCMARQAGESNDLRKVPMSGINRVSVGGNAHFLSAEDFLQMTPSADDLGLGGKLSRADLNCRALFPSSQPVLTVPSLKVPTGFPLWDME
jgi:hypothetical protein